MNTSMHSFDNANSQVLRSSSLNPVIPQIGSTRSVPSLPPRPGSQTVTNSYSPYSPYSPYSGGYNSYSSYGYRSPMAMGGYGLGNSYGYGSYGGYGGYGNYGMYGMDTMAPRDDAERRFVNFAEESSRNTFANVENVVRAVNSISMMLDNTFFAMTSSFRAVLSVAENFGRLRSMFGHIWYTVNIFRLFKWLYRKAMQMLGYEGARGVTSTAWSEVCPGTAGEPSGGSSWPTLAFLGLLMSAPYFISKYLLPKYEDKHRPEMWKSPGVSAKVAFDFNATAPNELSLRVNDEILIAPTYIQEEMKLTNSGWAFALCRNRSGLIPLNYVVFTKRMSNGVLKKSNSGGQELPVPRDAPLKQNGVKRVSFGENQIIESNGTERIVKIPDMDKEVATDERKDEEKPQVAVAVVESPEADKTSETTA